MRNFRIGGVRERVALEFRCLRIGIFSGHRLSPPSKDWIAELLLTSIRAQNQVWDKTAKSVPSTSPN